MANVFFKRGLLSNLPATKVDGAIYVTTDERAMYVDYNDGTEVQRIRLGDFIEVTNTAELNSVTPVKEALYYVRANNALVKYSEVADPNSGSHWIVLNSQGDISDLIKYLSHISSSVIDGIKLTTRVAGADGDSGNIVEGEVIYTSSDASLLKISGTNTSGTNSNQHNAGVVFTPANIVDKAKISATKSMNDITLTVKNERTGTDAAGQTVNDTSDEGTSIKLTQGNGITLNYNESSNAITISSDGGVSAIAGVYDTDGNLVIRVTDVNSNNIDSSAIPMKVTYGANTATVDADFSRGVATLDVYTTAQVDAKISDQLRALNSMTFKGSLDNRPAEPGVHSLPTVSDFVEVGDTYKVTNASNYNGQDCKVGDMWIATGTEDSTTGYITSDLVWVYIPSGNDDTASYSFTYDSTNKIIKFMEGETANTNFFLGTDLTAEQGASGITVKHADVSHTDSTKTAVKQSSQQELEFDIISGLTISDTGHVTNIETQKITVVDTSSEITNVAYSKAKDATEEKITTTLTITDSNQSHFATESLASSSLTLSVSGTQTNIDLVWGSF